MKMTKLCSIHGEARSARNMSFIRSEDNIKTDCDAMNWTELTQNRTK